MKRKKGTNVKWFLILLIIALLIAAINLNRNLILIQKQQRASDKHIQQLEQQLSLVDKQYAELFTYHEERLDQIESMPIKEVIHTETIETNSNTYEADTDLLNPAMWTVTLLATLKTVGKFLVPAY